MTNAEKFSTAEERIAGFNKFCGPCEKVDCDRYYALDCFNSWLDDEAEEEKIENCPFCGARCELDRDIMKVVCTNCGYESETRFSPSELIAAHNRVVRAVMEAGKKEEK